MTIPISQLSSNTNTFGDWLTTTNALANAVSTVVVTVNSSTPPTGNAAIVGAYQANAIFVSTITGGVIGNTAPIAITSNTTFQANTTLQGNTNNLGAAANLIVTGSNATNFVVAANTATGRLRFLAIDSDYIGTLSLNATKLESGTVNSARVAGVYSGITGTGELNVGSIASGFGDINIGTSTFTGNGSGLGSLNGSNVSSGTVPAARLGSGTANTTTFLRGDNSWQNVEAFPSGTRMLFQQTSAPTGWTKVTDAAINNKALRVVTGAASSGGTQDFTTAFASGRTTSSDGSHSHTITVNNHTLTAAQIPAHTHTFSGTTSSDGWHAHSGTILGGVTTSGFGALYGSQYLDGTTFTSGSGENTVTGYNINYQKYTTGGMGGAGTHSHTYSGTTSSIGSSGAHNHTASSNSTGGHSHTLNLDVAYIDLIIATKN